MVIEIGVRAVESGDSRPAAADRSDSLSVPASLRPAAPRYDRSEVLGWRLHPDTVQAFRRVGVFDTTVRSNSLGFRGGPITPHPEGIVRLAVLGDSYAFGWGVEESETYAAQLEARLDGAVRPCEVVNAALPGFGTFQRLRALELVLPLGVDGVIAEFSVSNDVVDDWRARFYVPDHLGRYQAEGTRFPAWEAWLSRHSRAIDLIRRRLMPLRLWLECRRTSNLERTRALWSELIDRCEEAGVPLLILINPSRHQVLADRTGMLGTIASTSFSHRPNRMLAELALERGVPVVDGEAEFAVPDPERLFLPGDAHWTPAGHARVADALARAWRLEVSEISRSR